MIERRSVDIDGSQVSYLEAGEGEPVLYLHGFPTSGHLWRDVMVPVAAQARAIAPDFPGFGRSELLKGPHTWAALLDWVGRFTETLGIDQLHLAVHDWGGLIGLPWFCENHDRVLSLLITDTSFSSTDRWHALATQWREPGIGEETIGSITQEGFEQLIRMGSPGMDQGSVEEFWRGLETIERRVAKLEMYRSLEFEMFEPYMPVFDHLASGRTRVIWGAADPFLPAKVATRFGERTGAEVTVIEGAGHFLQQDAGDEIGKLHAAFLAR